MTPALPPISAAPAAAPPQDRDRLAKAAKDFEAIFVRQMLAAARKTDFGGNDLFGGPGLETFRQMQDERFAEIAAERGTFGIAKLLEGRLNAKGSAD
ncbi:MAG TPA: rod-binding protein [Novosphingobium sp.]|nr:rod-binding protein [Novosphingobium sp.]